MDYSKFLFDKTITLRTKCSTLLQQSAPNICSHTNFDLSHTGFPFSDFTPVTPTEVRNLINSTDLKSSPVDVIPSLLIKSCINSFSVIISHLANLSFSQGHFPSKFKKAQITPLLKKPNLDPSDLSNYRPISNLSTVSKLLERLALNRLAPHLMSSNFNPFQSAYRKMHSTETALLRTVSDIHNHIDSGSSVLAVSLDLSAAFDTVPHFQLLNRMQTSFGITGSALSWLKSYLDDRTQFVCVGDKRSTPQKLITGVPQGSVLGPLLFSTFTSPVFPLISSFNLCHQQYADDTLIFGPINPSNVASSVNNIENCLSSLCLWLAHNGLSVNPTKSEAIIFSTRQRLQKLQLSGLTSVSVYGSPIPFSSTLTLLGVTLDPTLSFNNHCSKTMKSCLYHLRGIRHIRPLLSDSDAQLLACSFAQSRFDYCNSLLYGTSTTNIHRLQRLQNNLAKLTFSHERNVSHTKLLASHHWLPIASRIQYKVASITHSVLSCNQPSYLSDCLTLYNPGRTLRSSDAHLLVIPRTLLTLTKRSFKIASPTVWNSLPLHIRTTPSHALFCKHLKTELYRNTYTP